MSIKTMIRVWDQSQHDGTKLLTLLALADWAADSGVLFYRYGNSKIAQRIRREEGTVKRHLRELRASGELYAPPRPGRKTSQKFITVGLSIAEITAVLINDFGLPETAAKAEAATIIGVNTDTSKVSEPTPISVNTDTSKVSELTPSSYPTSFPTSFPALNPKGDPKEARPPFVLPRLDPANAVDARTMAIAEACQLDLAIPQHRDKCERAAAQLFRFTAEEITRRYGGRRPDYNGWQWYAHDWRGLKDEVPTPNNIVATINYQAPAATQSASGQQASAADVLAAALGGSTA